jgi:hypothetical protein
MAVRSGEIDKYDDIDEAFGLVQNSVPLSLHDAAELLPELRKLHEAGIPREALSIVQSGNKTAIVIQLRLSTVLEQVRELRLPHVLAE